MEGTLMTMHLFFLGTAAAEGYPGIFCRCDHCLKARRLGGKNLRYRSALLVNDDLLIDFGPDLSAAAQRFGLSLWGVKAGLVTHAHEDHFHYPTFRMRSDSFTGKLPPPLLSLYGPQDITEILEKNYPDLAELHLKMHTVHAFDAWKCGKYSFTAFQAYHAVETLEALFYSVDDGEHAFLYATDTGRFPVETRQALVGRSFDVIILEETLGEGKYEQHLGFDSFLEEVQWMRSEGLLRPGGRVIAHHFSHSGNPSHAELEAFLGSYGVEPAYDGLEIILE
jgi:phosphoribosyl 1,2-cyclic phosphate phosphodiesterase